jgi:hypothetical protein
MSRGTKLADLFDKVARLGPNGGTVQIGGADPTDHDTPGSIGRTVTFNARFYWVFVSAAGGLRYEGTGAVF